MLDSHKANELVMTINPKDQVEALNGMVLLINVAYKRGAYSLIEAAKIWESLRQFTPPEDENKQIKHNF